MAKDIKFDNPVAFYVENTEEQIKAPQTNIKKTPAKAKPAQDATPKAELSNVEPLAKQVPQEFKVNKFEKMYSPHEAAILLDLHVATVLRKIKKGELKARKKGGSSNGGGRYFIPESEILAYLNSD